MDSKELKSRYEQGDRNFEGLQLNGINLGWATLADSSFRGSDFYGANLSGANLKNSDLSGNTNLAFVDLSRADLAEANLRGANLEGANLEGVNLEGALYDDQTTFPIGFDPLISNAIQYQTNRNRGNQPEPLPIPQKEEPQESELQEFKDVALEPESKTNESSLLEVEISKPSSLPEAPKQPDLEKITLNNTKKNPSTKNFSLAVGSGIFVFLAGFLLIQFPKSNMPQGSPTSVSGESSFPSVPSNITEVLDKSQAQQIIKRWLTAKSSIFAPPYDRQLLAELTTGKRYRELISSEEGISWYIANNAYFKYNLQEVISINQVNIIDEYTAHIDAVIDEERILYINGRVDPRWSVREKTLTRYKLLKKNGTWKIEDYEDI